MNAPRRNLVCVIFGHRSTEPTSGVEVCTRCESHAAYYLDGSQWSDRERYGLVQPLRRLYWSLRLMAVPRCLQCGRVLYLPRLNAWLAKSHRDPDFCCEECFTKWIPF